MKKLLVALILGVILTATLATPAFADEGNGNMGGKNAGADPGDPSSLLINPQGWVVGLVNGLYYHLAWGHMTSELKTGKPHTNIAYGWILKPRAFFSITNGQPPAKPWWAGGP